MKADRIREKLHTNPGLGPHAQFLSVARISLLQRTAQIGQQNGVFPRLVPDVEMLRLMGLEPFQSRLRLAHVEPQFEPFAVSRPFLERRVKIGERFGIPAFQIIRGPRERPPFRRAGRLGLERFDFFSRGREIPRPKLIHHRTIAIGPLHGLGEWHRAIDGIRPCGQGQGRAQASANEACKKFFEHHLVNLSK